MGHTIVGTTRGLLGLLEKSAYTLTVLYALYQVATRGAATSAQWSQDATSTHRQDVRRHSGLVSGWLPVGTGNVDQKDSQYRTLRENWLLIVGVVAVWFGIKTAALTCKPRTVTTATQPSTVTRAPRAQIALDFALSFAVVIFLHEFYVVALLLAIFVSFALTKLFFVGRGGWAGWAGIWAVNVLLLLSVSYLPEINDNLLAQVPMLPRSARLFLSHYAQFRGELSWTATLRFVILRLISFELDAHWAILSEATTTRAGSSVETAVFDPAHNTTDAVWKRIAAVSHARQDYSLFTLLAFSFYLPVFATGPMNSFNVYLFCRKSNRRPSWRWMLETFARLVILALAIELFLHVFHPAAIMLNLSPTLRATTFQCCSAIELLFTCYLTIIFLWLKFSFIWTFARLWATLDGVIAVDNMPRFINAVHTPSQFWRSWHASFHVWLVRYMYRPLICASTMSGAPHEDRSTQSLPREGPGRRVCRRTMATSFVFAFVAIWHEVSPQLAIWGLGFAVAVSADNCLKLSRTQSRGVLRQSAHPSFRSVASRYAHALAGTTCILVLLIGNIIAYGYR